MENFSKVPEQIRNKSGSERLFQKRASNASCDSGFSTDSDELSFSGDESPSPVVTPQPTESESEVTSTLDASVLPLSRSWTWYYLNNQSKNWDERINKIAELNYQHTSQLDAILCFSKVILNQNGKMMKIELADDWLSKSKKNIETKCSSVIG